MQLYSDMFSCCGNAVDPNMESIVEHYGCHAGNTAHKPPLGMNELKLHTNRAEPKQAEGGVEDTVEQTAAAGIMTNSPPVNNVVFIPCNVRVPCSS